MHPRKDYPYLLVFITTACTSSTVQRPVQPLPLPSLPIPVASVAGPWAFNRASGAISYQISRSAAIESQSDSIPHREVSTNTTHEIITLDLADDTIHFTAIIDTSSTLTQGTVGPVQPVQLPTQVSGWLVGDSLTISNDSIAQKCDPVISALSADLHSLLIGFPIQLSQGNNWRDSVELRTCQAMILTTARIARSYVVSGEIIYQGSPAVVVQRRDLIHAHGEGAQQQHRLVLDVSGTGNATYYLSPQNGVILCLSTGQDLDLAITTSGKIYRFKQSSKQDFSSVR